ncbi:transmembrane anchor protein [Thalassobaculum sp.]|uniref:transmembrane anchor protein n=1 Tax=Thalassobaculum sp. TaxID=2022740 RepID=UPI0032EBE85E
MYNANKPNPDDLPSSAQLIRSTIIAVLAAIVILITIILPAEYGIDPTRIGRLIGLAEMGEIKTQLAEEAEEDRLRGLQNQTPANAEDKSSSWFDRLPSLFISTAHAHGSGGHGPGTGVNDEVVFTLEPGQGIEIKLVMLEGAVADFIWFAEGGKVNFDLHGDGSGQKISYEKGRSVEGQKGTLTAAFTGNHGWFWRNRNSQPVTITLVVSGEFSEIKRFD